MDLASLMSFAQHELILNWLFNRLSREAPTGYRAASLDQFHIAWTKIFQDLVKECRDGVRPLPDGTRPLETALVGRLQDPDIALLMQPLPISAAAARTPGVGTTPTAPDHGQQQPKNRNKEKKSSRL